MITMVVLMPHASDIEVHTAIRYSNAYEWTPSEIDRKLWKVYGEQQVLSVQAVQKRVRQFKEGCMDVQDLSCVGRLSTKLPMAVILLGCV